MKLLEHRFYRGPNLWSSSTGLLVTIADQQQLLTAMAWPAGAPDEMSSLAILRQVFPLQNS